MRDVKCGKCGEPWEMYHVNHEFTDEEKDNFLRGRGCPTCDWGESVEEPEDDVGYCQQRVDQVKDMMRNSDEDPLKYL